LFEVIPRREGKQEKRGNRGKTRENRQGKTGQALFFKQGKQRPRNEACPLFCPQRTRSVEVEVQLSD
jgi:hypothetical protein